MNDVIKEPFILLSDTHCLGEQIVSSCRQQECLPTVSCQSSQLLTAHELVALNHGVSLIPEMAAAIDRSKQREYKSISGAKPTRTLALIWHKNCHQSPLAMRFIEALRKHAREKEE